MDMYYEAIILALRSGVLLRIESSTMNGLMLCMWNNGYDIRDYRCSCSVVELYSKFVVQGDCRLYEIWLA